MDLNDPRIDSALRSYERQFLVERQLKGAEYGLPGPVGSTWPSAPAVPLSMGPPEWGKLLLPPGNLEPRPALQRPLSEMGQLGKFLSEIFEMVGAFGEVVARIVRALVEGLRPVAESLGSAAGFLEKLPRVLPSLEDLWEAYRRFARAMRDGDAVLEAAEYGFADYLWDWVYVASFAGVPDGVRAAVVTNRLAAETRSDNFGEELRERFGTSKAMGRRWRAVEAAFEAHQRRDYLLSIPAMLPQVEGAIVDAMVLKGLTVRKGGRLYLRGEDGRPEVLGRAKKPREITLHVAATRADLEDHPTLEGASSFIAGSLVPRRNAVLHGRDVRYDTAKPSVQALLVLALLAETVGELEEAKKVGGRA